MHQNRVHNRRGGFRHKHENLRKNYSNDSSNRRDNYNNNYDDRANNNNNNSYDSNSGPVGPSNMQHRIRGRDNRPFQRNDQRPNDNNNRRQGNMNRPMNSRRGGHGGNNQQQGMSREELERQWYKVCIPEGKTSTRDQILNQLQDLVCQPFIAYNYHVDNNGANFFVQGEQLSSSLRSFNRRITSPVGGKMQVKTNRIFLPTVIFDDKLREHIKVALSRRYNGETKALNISLFREDSVLKELGIFLAVSRNEVLTVIMEIIQENIPELVSIDVSCNELFTLEAFKKLSAICKNVKSVNLSQNKIPQIKELDYLKDWDLEEIHIKMNPFTRLFKEETAAVSSIRAKFPKILKLDDTILPPPICFDVEEEHKVPESKGGYMPDSTSEFVSKFLEQYYSLFDSDDRQPLIAAYHEQALFSYTVSGNQETDKFKSRPVDKSLYQDSRNILRIKDDLRTKTLKQGKVNVVAALCDLPKTKHEPLSFLIDVPLYNDCIIQIVVNGVLRLTDGKSTPLIKAFCRLFTVVPHNGGFVITNDQLIISNASVEQIKKYGNHKARLSNAADFNEMEIQSTSAQLNSSNAFQNQSTSSANHSFNTSTSTIIQNSSLINSTIQSPSTSGFNSTGDSVNAQREMILAQFCEATKMNRSFAHQCLSENDYDPNRSMDIFRDLSSRGLIPSEAFT